MTTRVTLTSAITAVEIAERLIFGGALIPRNESAKEKLREDLKGAVEHLRRLEAAGDFGKAGAK